MEIEKRAAALPVVVPTGKRRTQQGWKLGRFARHVECAVRIGKFQQWLIGHRKQHDRLAGRHRLVHQRAGLRDQHRRLRHEIAKLARRSRKRLRQAIARMAADLERDAERAAGAGGLLQPRLLRSRGRPGLLEGDHREIGRGDRWRRPPPRRLDDRRADDANRDFERVAARRAPSEHVINEAIAIGLCGPGPFDHADAPHAAPAAQLHRFNDDVRIPVVGDDQQVAARDLRLQHVDADRGQPGCGKLAPRTAVAALPLDVGDDARMRQRNEPLNHRRKDTHMIAVVDDEEKSPWPEGAQCAAEPGAGAHERHAVVPPLARNSSSQWMW